MCSSWAGDQLDAIFFLALPAGLNRIPSAGLHVPSQGLFPCGNWGRTKTLLFRFYGPLSLPVFTGARDVRENHAGT